MRLSTVVSWLATLTHSLLVNNVLYNVIVICIVMLFMWSPYLEKPVAYSLAFYSCNSSESH